MEIKARSSRSEPPIKAVVPPGELEPDTSGWLTRNQCADLTRMSVTTIANYERRGKLHPRYAYRPDSRGIEHRVAVYNPDEIAKLPSHALRNEPAREPGELAARCFELFDQGLSVREIVIELRETPDRVRVLYESWLDGGGANLTITGPAQEAFVKVVGPFSSVADLLTLVEGLAKRGDLA